ncbi:MAG: transcriptional repressor [Deltaproteobacteria bacterium]|nr:transcriptional repressor [Deltaproteobacteria bacterium]MBW2138722.1 transcriptional repressor [Deltaproteobacteria bacterium]
MTPQRKVILEEVCKEGEHLTADEIYDRVRKRLPRISMGTVYRNLDLMASQGLIRKLQPDYPQMRFDGNTRDHYHLLCMRCGRISDAPVAHSDNALEILEGTLGNLTRYGIFGHKLEFIGLCPECMEKEKNRPEDQRLLF